MRAVSCTDLSPALNSQPFIWFNILGLALSFSVKADSSKPQLSPLIVDEKSCRELFPLNNHYEYHLLEHVTTENHPYSQVVTNPDGNIIAFIMHPITSPIGSVQIIDTRHETGEMTVVPLEDANTQDLLVDDVRFLNQDTFIVTSTKLDSDSNKNYFYEVFRISNAGISKLFSNVTDKPFHLLIDGLVLYNNNFFIFDLPAGRLQKVIIPNWGEGKTAFSRVRAAADVNNMPDGKYIIHGDSAYAIIDPKTATGEFRRMSFEDYDHVAAYDSLRKVMFVVARGARLMDWVLRIDTQGFVTGGNGETVGRVQGDSSKYFIRRKNLLLLFDAVTRSCVRVWQLPSEKIGNVIYKVKEGYVVVVQKDELTNEKQVLYLTMAHNFPIILGQAPLAYWMYTANRFIGVGEMDFTKPTNIQPITLHIYDLK